MKDISWQVSLNESYQEAHFLPSTEYEEHIVDGYFCSCRPKVYFLDGFYIKHNSFDNREYYQGGKKFN